MIKAVSRSTKQEVEATLVRAFALGTVSGAILGPDRPKRGQDALKKAIKNFKVPKTCICENLTEPNDFHGFCGPGLSKVASEGPEASERHLKSSKPQKRDPKTNLIFTSF